ERCAGERNEVSGRATRAGREPGLRSYGQGSLRPLPPADPAFAAAGEECARLRAPERAQALAPTERGCAAAPAGCRVVGRMVRWMEAAPTDDRGSFAAGSGITSQLVAYGRLAPPWARGSGGNPRSFIERG